MEKDVIQVANVDELVSLERRLEEISDKIQKLKLQNILNMSRDSITEIKSLSRKLKEKNLLNNENYRTKELKVSLSKEYSIESNIMKIYAIIANELENWRRLYINLI